MSTHNMKKNFQKITAILLSIIFILSVIAGCSRGGGDEGASDRPGLAYTIEIIDPPFDLPEPNNLTLIGERLIFSSIDFSDDGSSFAVTLFSKNLDGSEEETVTIDITDFSRNVDVNSLFGITVDDRGNIYLADGSSVYILDNTGSQQFRLDYTNFFKRFIRLSDGTVALVTFKLPGSEIKPINTGTRAWGETIDLPNFTTEAFSGSERFKFLHGDETNLYGVDNNTGETVKILNWIEVDLGINEVGYLFVLPDERIICTVTAKYSGRAPQDTATGQGIVITLSGVYIPSNIKSAIIDFNRNNPDYIIEVNDYSGLSTPDDFYAGMMKLSTEIIAGNIPDILVTSLLPVHHYAAKGLLEDLIPFINSDPALGLDDMLEPTLNALKSNDGLYQIIPSFNVFTILGSSDVLGNTPGWNMDEFIDVINAHPNATTPLGPDYDREGFLNVMLMSNINEYVDWNTGGVYFDTGSFARLLELAMIFPESVDKDRALSVRRSELIARGEQIMLPYYIVDFVFVYDGYILFGDDVIYKGFPSVDRRGNLMMFDPGLAMSSTSGHKDIVWQFMRTILTEEWQRDNVLVFPSNAAVFNERLLEATTPDIIIDENGKEIEVSKGEWLVDGDSFEMLALTEAQSEKLMTMINSLTGRIDQDDALNNIIIEGAAEFFSGRLTADAAAAQIQNRVSIYVAEQR